MKKKKRYKEQIWFFGLVLKCINLLVTTELQREPFFFETQNEHSS